MHPILTRLGADVLVARMNRVREDERIKAVGPDSWVLPCPTPGPQALDPAFTPMYDGETEIWFDWAFVDFWKANICERLACGTDLISPRALRYDSARNCGGSGLGGVVDGYVQRIGRCYETSRVHIDATPSN
jgi:hypothetical protein